jgi:hypothetical protein
MDEVIIKFSISEALVLFELLARTSNEQTLQLADQAERQALWNLECMLERELSEPFLPNYEKLLERAKSELTFKE